MLTIKTTSLLIKKRAQLQFEILEKEHKWLSDGEADQRMKQKKDE